MFMPRRTFSRTLLSGAALGAVGGLGLLGVPDARAQRIALREGTDFMRLARPVPVWTQAGQVEVHEFFAYTCIHCHQFEPLFENWVQRVPAHVVVHRTPVGFSRDFVPLQRLYYTLEAMGLVPRLHGKVFSAIHEERRPVVTPAAIVDWVAGQGVDRARFVEVFNSGATNDKVNLAIELQDLYGVEGTPALGIAGRYYVPGQGPRTLIVADGLIAEARKGA